MISTLLLTQVSFPTTALASTSVGKSIFKAWDCEAVPSLGRVIITLAITDFSGVATFSLRRGVLEKP